ncbi:MAG: HK97 gp10 family phage protein [Halanaerobiales bacterium]|nr:HK97 gp10 family phage protein [Halanaerobiales bacterium]
MPQNNWIEVEFTGLDKTVRTLEKIKSDILNETDRIMLRAALILEAEVKRLITNMKLVDTGTLRAGVHSFVRSQFGYVDGVVGTNIEYAIFPEYGTGQRGAANPHPELPSWYQYGDSPGIQAYKYMWTAWENVKGVIMAYISAQFRKLVNVNARLIPTT